MEQMRVPVVFNPHVPTHEERWDHGPRPRSKRKRVRNKWERKYGKWVRRRVMYMIGGTLLTSRKIMGDLAL